MKQYTIVISKAARKFIANQPQNQRNRLFKAIYKLPHSGNIKQLAGYSNLYRLRVGDYRVIYSVNENILTIEVLNAGNRGDIYK